MIEGVQFSALDFYRSVEDALTARQVPRMQVKHVEYHEGSLLSDKRVYLRLARERFAFDVCAAPFGTGYFFSLRLIVIPRGGWIQLLLLLAGVFGLLVAANALAFYALFAASRSFWWMIAALALIAVLVSAVRTARKEDTPVTATMPRTMPDFDRIMLCLPVIGDWYERIRKDTYYRHDTRLLFQQLVSEVVKEKVEELTAAKGVKLVQSYEYSPILGELYRPMSGGPAPANRG